MLSTCKLSNYAAATSPLLITTNWFKGWTQWAFVPFGLTLIYTTENIQILATKPWVDSSSLAVWINSINNQLGEFLWLEVIKEKINRENLGRRTWINFRNQISHKKCNGLAQWTFVPLGTTLIYTTANIPTLATKTFLTSSYLTYLINTINNQLDELGMVDLKPLNQLMMTS